MSPHGFAISQNRAPALVLPLIILALLFAAGCRTRGPHSPFIDVPLDHGREAAQGSIEQWLRSENYQLPVRADAYVMGPGDVISITLVGRPDILGIDDTGEKFLVTITDSPIITLPLIGAIRIHGKTADEFQHELRAAYSDYIQNPVPLVSIERQFHNQVAVLGAVTNPGRYPLEYGDTLAEAIFKAGGLTFGGRTGGLPPGRYLKVYREKISRRDRTELPLEELLAQLREGQRLVPREEILVPIERFIFSGDMIYNLPLRANDIVFIPPAGTVNVQGQVRRPGVVFLGPSLRTLSDVITETGGLRYGAASRVEIVRTRQDGSQLSYFLPARRILRNETEDFLLRDNDRILFHRHPMRGLLADIGSIFRATVTTGAQATYNPVN